MTDAMRHRGPDDGGTMSDGHVALGNRRLSIIDLGGGHQPMSDETKAVTIVYNGEVYNFRELRAALAARGRSFQTSSDTEVILRLYEEEGPAGVARLRGMFAFAIWDAPRRRLLVARDQLGIKPLYYHDDGETLAFASEIRPLLLRPGAPRRLHLPALDAFLTFSYVPGADTAFEGIRRLPPGHLLVCEEGRVEMTPYWQLRVRPRAVVDEAAAAMALRGCLQAAVERHLVADVPVGVFLSGGIDSSAIVALLAEAGRRDTPTFSIGFDGAGYFDESADARAVAAHFGMAHQTLPVRADVAGLLSRVVESLEEPLGDPSTFLTYLISHAAREHVKVALTGMGGDELFAGYRRYQGVRLIERLRRLPGPARRVLLAAVEAVPATDATRLGYRLTMLRRLLEAARTPHPDAYISTLSYFGPATRSRLLAPEVRAQLAAHDAAAPFRALWHASAAGDDLLARVLAVDVPTFLGDNLLLFSDKMSMAASLELRVPLLDLEVVEFAASLPEALRIRDGETKYLLRRALAPLLPATVLRKPKQGFTAPVGSWLRGELRGLADELLAPEVVTARRLFDPATVSRMLDEHRRGRREWGHHLFSLMVLELWSRRYLGPGALL